MKRFKIHLLLPSGRFICLKQRFNSRAEVRQVFRRSTTLGIYEINEQGIIIG